MRVMEIVYCEQQTIVYIHVYAHSNAFAMTEFHLLGN